LLRLWDNSEIIFLIEALFVVIVIFSSVSLRLPEAVKIAAYTTINTNPAIKKYQLIKVHFALVAN
jgi:hypothetical protein